MCSGIGLRAAETLLAGERGLGDVRLLKGEAIFSVYVPWVLGKHLEFSQKPQ